MRGSRCKVRMEAVLEALAAFVAEAIVGHWMEEEEQDAVVLVVKLE